MDHAFIAGIESWGSGGQMLDVIMLTDGEVLVVMQDAVVLYANRDAFDAGSQGKLVGRHEHRDGTRPSDRQVRSIPRVSSNFHSAFASLAIE